MASLTAPSTRVLCMCTPRSLPHRRTLTRCRGISTTTKPLRPVAVQSRRSYSAPIERAPKIDRSRSKLFKSADEAVADIQSGSTILSAGFGLCGVAETIIQAIERRGKESLHSLTAVSNNAGIEGVGGLSLITKSGQVNKLILSFLGNNKALEKKYLSGGIAVELCPQGSLAERIRAGGAGIPAFFTPTAASMQVSSV